MYDLFFFLDEEHEMSVLEHGPDSSTNSSNGENNMKSFYDNSVC